MLWRAFVPLFTPLFWTKLPFFLLLEERIVIGSLIWIEKIKYGRGPAQSMAPPKSPRLPPLVPGVFSVDMIHSSQCLEQGVSFLQGPLPWVGPFPRPSV